jgi:UDP-GlcNAc:undecaprenyl-phosphate GlcNAc-1-phosphate transferase
MIARLRRRNYRGREVSAVLGLPLATGGAVSAAAVAILDHVTAAGWVATAAAALVGAAGLVDDLQPEGPRGIRGHLREVARGRLSTGVIKLVVAVAAAVITVAASDRPDATARIAGVVLVAACSNLWNGLDVRPGRAIKFALPALLFVGAIPWPSAPFVPGVAVAALLILPWDAGERAMLGDAGATLLGFAIGVQLFLWLTTTQLLVAAVLAVTLNVLADTITLSRCIDAVPPLRWWDRLGRGDG